MSILEALILGIIQGLTEFLPVSSSGHIELGKVLLGVEVKDSLLFSIVVHGATALSTIIVFRKVIADIIRDSLLFKWNDSANYMAKIAVSMIPVFIIGVGFEDEIEAFFQGDVLLVGSMLIVTGILLYLTLKVTRHHTDISYKKAGVIGIAQAIAILPGISRSGATISTALLLNVDKEKAARFSFLMVIPPILGATLLKTIKYFETASEPVASVSTVPATAEISQIALITGFMAAFVSGLFACNWMIRIVKNSKLQYFAYYCFAVGIFAIISSLFI